MGNNIYSKRPSNIKKEHNLVVLARIIEGCLKNAYNDAITVPGSPDTYLVQDKLVSERIVYMLHGSPEAWDRFKKFYPEILAKEVHDTALLAGRISRVYYHKDGKAGIDELLKKDYYEYGPVENENCLVEWVVKDRDVCLALKSSKALEEFVKRYELLTLKEGRQKEKAEKKKRRKRYLMGKDLAEQYCISSKTAIPLIREMNQEHIEYTDSVTGMRCPVALDSFKIENKPEAIQATKDYFRLKGHPLYPKEQRSSLTKERSTRAYEGFPYVLCEDDLTEIYDLSRRDAFTLVCECAHNIPNRRQCDIIHWRFGLPVGILNTELAINAMEAYRRLKGEALVYRKEQKPIPVSAQSNCDAEVVARQEKQNNLNENER